MIYVTVNCKLMIGFSTGSFHQPVHENVGHGRVQRRPHCHAVNLVIKFSIKLQCCCFACPVYGMNKRQFRKLLNWTCKTTTLQFDGKFYHQIDGMAMGSPLDPAMADIFMNWLVETACTKSNHQFTVYRYIDHLFLTFDDPNPIDHVFSTFNSIHQKIKFTKENQENNKLAFLDVQITKNSDCIETSIFRKNTNLGIYTRWESYVPNRYKQSLVWTLLHRAYSICNSVIVHEKKKFKKFQTFSRKMDFP